ncbi:MAG: hypothetical protein KGM98_15195, partial [Bacteroidota bacterium]|nr:hypothetical protein [Bacteroidota bacterium]
MYPFQKNTVRKLWGCLCFTGISLGAWAQSNPQLVARKIDEQNGLSDNTVQCIYKDHRNFIWIGTASGLNEMNGSSITIFRNEPTVRSSLSNNDIRTIQPAPGGNLWIGTMGGLNYFDPVADTFHLVPLRYGNNPLKDNIDALAMDSKGNLFIGTLEGLFWLKKDSLLVQPLILPGSLHHDFLANNSITDLAIDSSGVLWISTYNGLWSYQTGTGRIQHEINPSNDPYYDPLITTVFVDHLGNIWCGSWHTGLKFIKSGTAKVVDIPFLLNTQVSHIAEIRQAGGSYLLWFDGQNPAYDPTAGRVVDIRHSLDLASNLMVRTLYVSPDRWLWVGTDKGLIFYDLTKALFQRKVFPAGITNQNVVLGDYHGNLLVGGSGTEFLKSYDSNFREVADYGPMMKRKDISCLSMEPLTDHTFAIGTTEGIATLDLTHRKIAYNPLTQLKKKESFANFIS